MQRNPQLNYAQTLGAIGRYLDQRSYDDLVLCELGEGFVGRVMQGGRLVEAIPFQTDDLATLVRLTIEEDRSGRAPVKLAPNPRSSFVRRTLGTYGEFLAALGHQFDSLDANSVLIAELTESVLVMFRRSVGPFESGQAASSEFLYDEAGIRRLLASQRFGAGD
jgi:hypothetical protein